MDIIPTEQSPTNKPTVNHESLKVYIRVRPKLKNEYLKEISVFTESTVNSLFNFRQ